MLCGWRGGQVTHACRVVRLIAAMLCCAEQKSGACSGSSHFPCCAVLCFVAGKGCVHKRACCGIVHWSLTRRGGLITDMLCDVVQGIGAASMRFHVEIISR